MEAWVYPLPTRVLFFNGLSGIFDRMKFSREVRRRLVGQRADAQAKAPHAW